ncbi:hypothetical protein MMC18_004616 [Xylographa bjoerkii]|nr:hypothetical protein [Xylographa bjoerkii]
MPLPDHPLVLHGGCNCRAIRYRITVPAQPARPLNPFSDGELTFPMIMTDHCNDCRRATGAILPVWICVPSDMMTCQLEPVSASNSEAAGAASQTESWIPATELFRPGPQSDKYWLKFYKSSSCATRSFCGRCGTNLTYAIWPSMGEGEGWPDIFDVVLGTLEREDLEKEYMAPDRHCWVECEIGWVRELTSGGRELPRHPTYKVNEMAD